MVNTMNMKAWSVITNMWNIAHILPGIGIMYHGKIAIKRNTNSPVNMFPNSLSARLNGFAISSTMVNTKLIGASAIPKGCTKNDLKYPPGPLIFTL